MKDQRCLNYRKAIKESEAQLFSLERHQTKALLRDRMRFLRLLKSGECTSQAQAGRVIGLKLRASEKLWRKYREGGLEGLLSYPYRGKPEKIPEAVKQELSQELSTDQLQSLEQVQHFIEQKSGVHYTIPGIHYVLERMQVKKKTGRPLYQDKDQKGEQRFKKKSSPS
jgi:transposase